ncbi:MAG: hypothetical protein FJ279_32985 [Planctomycetes bacterium]|nr:hypothetical protein [Planctomycetota bacterium]
MDRQKDWREHIRETAYRWLLGERPRGCLGENLLLLFGNPDEFDAPRVKEKFDSVEQVGVFLKGRYRVAGQEGLLSYTTPKFGAPIVSHYVEVAAMAGVKRIISVGYVGGLADDVRVGELFLCDRAMGLDGTTRSYFGGPREFAATPRLSAALEKTARAAGVGLSRGTVVSIDALMLECSAWVAEWRAAGYGAVDLETACLFGLGEKLGLECAALHIVSDSPYRSDTDREARHMASLDDQLRIALESMIGAGR